MPKVLKVAGEVDGYCTRCRMVLNHRIVSMKGAKAHQVECLTCRTTHLWRAAAPGEKAEKVATSSSGKTKSGSTPRAPRMTAAVRLEQTWEKAVGGRDGDTFKPYTVATTFREGELIRHKKFGDGVVTRVIDPHKVEVLFRDEPRTLAQAMA